MAKTTDTIPIWLGSRENTKQGIVAIPAEAAAHKSGLLFLEAVDSSGILQDGLYIWARSDDTLAYDTSVPSDEATSGTTLASGAATAALLANVTVDNTLLKGDLAARNLQNAGIVVDDSDNVSSMGTLGCGTITSTGNLVIGNAGTIGSASDTDAIAISSGGVVTLTQNLILPNAGNIGSASDTDAIAIASTGIVTFTQDIVIADGMTIGPSSYTDAITLSSAGKVTMKYDGEITANATVGGTLGVTGNATFAGTLSMGDDDRIILGAGGASDAYIQYDSSNDQLEFYDIDTDTVWTLKELATGTTLNPTINGNLTITDGDFDWVNTSTSEVATWTFSTATTVDAILMTADDIDTGNALKIHADVGGAAGSVLKLDCLGSGMDADSRYLTCYNHDTDALAIKRYGEVEIAGLEGSDMFTITAGDAVITEGSLTITDNDDATSFKVENDNITTNTSPIAYITSGTLTQGIAFQVQVDSMTTGTFIDVKDTSSVFSVKLNGATAIAGSAHGTDALTITAGDITLTDGFIEAGATASGTGHGHTFATADDGTNDTALVTMSNSVAGFDMPLLQLTGASSGDINTMQITNAGTGYGISETMSLAAGEGVEIIFATGGTHNGIFIDGGTGTYVGADTYGMLKIHQTGTLLHANASAIFVDFDGTPAASGLGYAINVDDDASAIGSTYAVSINSAANNPLKLETGAVGTTSLTVKNVASATASTVVFDGTGTSWIGNDDDVGMVQLKGDTANTHVGGTLLHVQNTAQLTGSSEGAVARFLASGTATSGAYAVEIAHTTTGGALNVSAGYSTFVDKATFTAGAQSSAVTVIALTGAGTAIPAGTAYVKVQTADPGYRVILPVPVEGNIIVLSEDGNDSNYELSTEADTQYINGTLCDGGPPWKELLVAAADTVIAVCIKGGAAGKWIVTKYDAAGAATGGGTPDA